MGKILYVEDELKSSDILFLFDKYLTDEEKSQLTKLQRKEDIKKLLEKNLFIHVEYNFIDAIKSIKCSFEEFSFFIIDRNLYAPAFQENVSSEYNKHDVPKLIDEPFESKYEKSEGEYLFLILLDYYWKHSDPRLLLENFYFLTALGEPKTVQESLGKLHLLFDSENHVIEKGSEQQKEFIETKINKFEDLVIKSEHRQVFEIFSKGYLKKSFEKDLLSVLKVVNTHDQSEIKKSVSLLRQIFEVGILGKIVEVLRKIVKIEDIKKQIPDDYDKKNNFKAYIVDLLLAKSGGNLKPRYILKFLAGSPKYIHTKK